MHYEKYVECEPDQGRHIPALAERVMGESLPGCPHSLVCSVGLSVCLSA